MTDIELELPPGWSETTEDDRGETVIAEYHHESTADTTFIVAINRPVSGPERYTVQLSTVDPTSMPTRHDYPVAEYDTLAAAVEGAQSVIDRLAAQLEDGTISSKDPSIEEIREFIRSFDREGRLLPLRDIILRFRR